MISVKNIPNINKHKIILGCAQLGMNYGIANTSGKPEDASAFSIIESAWNSGITAFDTAQAYGESEERLGVILKELGINEKADVITKFSPSLNPTDIGSLEKSFESSLDKLNSNCIWCLMLHRFEWLSFMDNGLGEFLCGLRRKGVVKYLGVSVSSPDEAFNVLDKDIFDIIQIPYNAWDSRVPDSGLNKAAVKKKKELHLRSIFLQGLLTMSPEAVKRRLPIAYKASLEWSSLAESFKITPRELALHYAASSDFPLVIGSETPEQVKENSETINGKGLTEKDIYKIRRRMEPYLTEKIVNPALWEVEK
jgi:aryl-alcohol dehydrogenase-like predicted oxidoreductase